MTRMMLPAGMRGLAALAALGSLAAAACAQTFELEHPTAPVEASAEIIGGQLAIPANWPATFVFKGLEQKPCTATAIGPRVLITAAHCLGTATSGTIKGSPIQLACEIHDLWENGYDVALCVSSAVIPTLNQRPYETLDPSGRPAAGRDRLTLIGYGCTAAGGTSGTLYEGTSPVGVANPQLSVFYTNGGAAVCAGDSGGSAYRAAGLVRRVVGIASAAMGGQQSRFLAVADGGVTSFIRTWATRQRDPITKQPVEIKICGLDQTLLVCHG